MSAAASSEEGGAEAQPASNEALRVLFVTPECAPLAKIGGLADVSAALPAALRSAGIDARILLPGYADVMEELREATRIGDIPVFRTQPLAQLRGARLRSGVPLMLVDHPLYRRSGGPYQDPHGNDWPDNAMRFGMLSRVAAVLSGVASPLDWRPHIVHLNDWPAALAAAYLYYGPEGHAATVVTVHNLAFQGNFDPALLAALELPGSSYAPEGLEFHGWLSFLKAGLYYSDAITTVSAAYAREIQGAQYGAGMEGLLAHRRSVLHGILNGIDTDEWNPATDTHLPCHYSSQDLENKRRVKRALCQRVGLDTLQEDIPLLGVVSRLTHQKGADLLIDAAATLAGTAQLIVLGAGQREYEEALRSLARLHPGRIAVTIGFDNALAHFIEAGADLFLMPSRFEPCGLNQMYSLRYGTPPVAHATGGLVDTIVDCTPHTLAAGTASGFLFTDANAAGLLAAVNRALDLYRIPETWRVLQRNGMSRDFSWAEPARRYAALYRALAQARVPGRSASNAPSSR